MKNDDPPLAFDLASLRVFLAVAEAGSMTAASHTLGLSQPAVSQSIARLESRFGAALVDRLARPMTPTTAGAELIVRARHLLDEAESLQTSVREAADSTLPACASVWSTRLPAPPVPI
jgi:DNA-binding transcriptional LysR family regulator